MSALVVRAVEKKCQNAKYKNTQRCVRVQEHLRQKRNHDEAKVMKDGRKGNRAQVESDKCYPRSKHGLT